MYFDGSITIMWSLNIFINDFPLPCRRVKISLFKILDSDLLFISSVFQLSSDNYLKFSQGCSANKKGVFQKPKSSHFKTALKHFKVNRKKVWERRSHAFPLNYTPAFNCNEKSQQHNSM